MANSEISSKHIFSGICIVVVAALIIWQVSTTVSHGTRISLQEKSSEYIVKSVDQLTVVVKELTDEIRESKRSGGG